jgi:mRNA interferase YafQ
MYEVKTSNRFEKDTIRCINRKYNLSLLEFVISLLESDGKLPTKYKTHPLKGSYFDCLECHIKPDWLLIWRQDDKVKTISLVRTGTHSDLF